MHKRKNNLTVMHRRKCRGMGWGKDMAWDWMCRLALIPNPCWLCQVAASLFPEQTKSAQTFGQPGRVMC